MAIFKFKKSEKWESRKKALNAKMLPSKNCEQGKHLTQICYIFVLLQEPRTNAYADIHDNRVAYDVT